MFVASRTALPPARAAAPAARQSRFRGLCWWGEDAPTLVALHTALLFDRAESAKGGPKLQTLAFTLDAGLEKPPGSVSRPNLQPKRLRGFTLIELLVALAAMAVMAGMSWRGLDGMVRAQAQIQQRTDAVLTLQAGLTQWAADLDALLQLPQTQTLDWDGRGLRIVRRSTAAPGQGVLVVAWARRNVNGVNQWLRWQSPPQFSRGELQTAWNKAAQWSQNPGEDDKRYEVRITALDEWQIFYFRGNAWTNPLSSDGAAAPVQGVENRLAPDLTLPDGVRLVLTLPPGQAISGVLTRDWVRPILGGSKS